MGPYHIGELIGAGGMGEVYKARDTRLERDIALKVLPASLTDDAERRARLVREARAASRLNHPNTVTIYDIGEQDGKVFVAMEYVPGKTLDSIIAHAGLPLADTLKYAIPIAAALTKAHAAGIIHRDLKPGNLMITPEGEVKVLDFGLAKLVAAGIAARIEPGDSTRTNQPQTQEGMFMGTPAFMSPEQAEGKAVDARSDIFSVGAVLYEMTTGKHAFAGDSKIAIMAAVIHKEPEPLPDTVPPDLQKIILRCLRKDPERRFQTMADVRVSLEELREASVSGSLEAVPAAARSSNRPAMRRGALIAAAILGVAALALGWRAYRHAPEAVALRTVKFTITPKQLVRGGDIDTELSISPDGQHIAFVESQGGQLWIRDIDEEQAHPVPGATGVYQAFWSPDNQYIGYSAGRFCAGCDLVKIPVQGGTPTLITKLAGGFRRASWSSDGQTIVYCDTTGMYLVPSNGGSPTLILKHPHIEHPSFLDLPGGWRAILYAAVDPDRPGGHGIYVQVVGETQRRFIVLSTSGNPYPAYSVRDGHIVYVDGSAEVGIIRALSFSLATLQPSGSAFPIAQHGSTPQVSRTGTLVYSDSPSGRLQLVWVDRSGKNISTVGEPHRQTSPVLSPDGRRLATEAREPDFDIWIYDLEQGIRTRFTFDKAQEVPAAWTPSGGELTFMSNRAGNPDIYTQSIAGNSEAHLLVGQRGWSPQRYQRFLAGSPMIEVSPDWSPDQRLLVYEAFTGDTKSQLLYRERRQDGTLGEPAVFRKTAFNEMAPRFSPDGRFVAYVSDESGKDEVYVSDFPKGASQWRISQKGGGAPRWRRDGREIFYIEPGGRLMAVSIMTRPAFTASTPELLFDKRRFGQGYDVSADGKRFIVLDSPGDEPPLSIHVVHNWYEDFRSQQSAAR